MKSENFYCHHCHDFVSFIKFFLSSVASSRSKAPFVESEQEKENREKEKKLNGDNNSCSVICLSRALRLKRKSAGNQHFSFHE